MENTDNDLWKEYAARISNCSSNTRVLLRTIPAFEDDPKKQREILRKAILSRYRWEDHPTKSSGRVFCRNYSFSKEEFDFVSQRTDLLEEACDLILDKYPSSEECEFILSLAPYSRERIINNKAGGRKMEDRIKTTLSVLMERLQHGAKTSAGSQAAKLLVGAVKKGLGRNYPTKFFASGIGKQAEPGVICALIYLLADNYDIPSSDKAKELALCGLEATGKELADSLFVMLLPVITNITKIDLDLTPPPAKSGATKK